MTGDLAERAPRSFAFGPFVLVPERQLLLKGEVPVRIGNRALDILTALVERPGELVDKRELLARGWPNIVVDESNLKVNVAALRRALGDDPGAARYIATVTGRGYRFIAPVQATQPAGEASASAAATAGSQSLPPGTARIFGRTGAIEAILRDLEESRIVSIVGAGGIGKTTVAIAATHAVAKERADGAAFVDLATIGDPQFVPTAIAHALGLGVTGGDPLSSVVHALKEQHNVLLFDNCEHLLPAVAAAVDRLARHLDDVRILATSREPLRIRGERVYRLRGLECDPSERPAADEARKFPAVELFATRAAERAGYRLTDAAAPAVAEICRRLDGNALAIELAATQTAAFSPAQILQMLDDSFRLLNLGPPGAPPRQQSLLATLDWSYSLLPEHEATEQRPCRTAAPPRWWMRLPSLPRSRCWRWIPTPRPSATAYWRRRAPIASNACGSAARTRRSAAGTRSMSARCSSRPGASGRSVLPANGGPPTATSSTICVSRSPGPAGTRRTGHCESA